MTADEQQLAERILDTALELAGTGNWEDVHLHDVAETLSISLEDIRRFYPQKDDLAEALFDRADRAVLGRPLPAEPPASTVRERLLRIIMLWLETLAPHRHLVRQMLAYKLEFGHVHLQALGLMRISRTVQWFREAAREDSRGLQRILEETTLTGVYLATFGHWLFDESTGSRSTQSFLDRALIRRENLALGYGQPRNTTTATGRANARREMTEI